MLKKLLSLLSVFSLTWLGCETQATYKNMELTEENFFNPMYQPLAKAVRKGKTSSIDQWLANGLDVNHVGKENMTLLMWAIVNHNKRSLTHLLKKGANPNYKDSQGTQPVGLAAGMDDIDYLRILLDNGGDPNSEDRGEKALITAIYTLARDHIYLLLEKGADINSRKSDGGHAHSILVLADLNQFEYIAHFLNLGADPKLTDDYGGSLAYGVQKATPNKTMDAYQWQIKVKQMLVERGVHFPVPHPWETEKNWQPIRRQWYQTDEGQKWELKMEEIGRDPEGFGHVWKAAYQAENDALKAWMKANNIPEPPRPN